MGAELERKASDAQVLSVSVPTGPLPPCRVLGLLSHGELSPFQGRSVTPRSLSRSRGSHAASSHAASRGQHPPHKGSLGSCQELRLRGFLRFFQPPLVLCCCVTVLATQPFAYLLFVTLTRFSLARFSSNPRQSREPPCGVRTSGWAK